MRIAVLAETAPGERRVAAVPETVERLVAAGWEVAVEAGAGRFAYVSDGAYVAAGASIVTENGNAGSSGIADVLQHLDVLLSVQPPPLRTLRALPPGATVVSFLLPSGYPDHIRACRDHGLTAFALELVPRTSRAQSMDVLSSQAMVAGYRATLAAAERLPSFFPMATTAAGTIPAAKVLVLGTGVAGLQAIATARRLGAATSGHDVRPSSAEEVRSLGATFLPLEPAGQEAGGYARVESEGFLAAQRQLLSEHVGRFDAVITTAAVPGRRAPLLLTSGMVEQMRAGSVVVDLAAESGGNCALTRAGEQIDHHGVVVYGPSNVASELPRQASELFSRNVTSLLMLMTRGGTFVPDVDDEVLTECCVTRAGRVVHPPARPSAHPPARVPGSDADSGSRRDVGPGTAPEVASLLVRSRKVVLVPGFGLAVARAQHVLRALADGLEDKGVEVSFAIHPVAGRMPGQLNALLDEAGVAHARLQGLEEANAGLGRTDAVVVVGANDVVNPAARMPILDVASARRVVVLKRSLRPGFAGIDNALFHDARTTMLFGDAKDTLNALVLALRSA